MALTTDDEVRAEKIVASWFWQMGEGHNFRWKNAVRSVTLFYESAPMSADIAQLVIEYLRSRESVTEFLVNNKKWTFDSPGWNAKDAWYQTASGEKWAGTESTKVRVFWVLVQAGDGVADGPYVVENGCKYKVSHSYYWDVASQPELPASSSGVQYSIQGFTRDRETGLFTYIVEKRETVQQDVALYDTAVTAFEIEQEEQHLGVKARDVAATGRTASVANGVRVERRVTKNPDCTSDVVNRVTNERNVKGAVKVWRKGLRGTVQTTTERSAASPLTDAGMEVGETRRSEMTPGELWNNTVEKTTTEAAGEIASECQKTIFEHRDSRLENTPTQPAKEVADAAGGVVRQKSIRKTEENTFDVTDVTTTERKVENARTVERRTLRGTSAATTHRNLNAAEIAAKTAAPIAVGETRTVERTPGDLKNLTVESFAPVAPQDLGKSCDALTTVHTDTTTEVVAADDIGFEEQTPEVNKEKQVSYRLNEDGKTADKTVTTRTWSERSAPGSTDSGGTVQTTVTHKINSPTAPAPVATGPNVVREVDAQPNEHGSFTTSERTTVYKEKTAPGSSNSGGVVQTTATHKVNSTTIPDAGAAGPNVVREVSSQPNDHGSFTVSERTTVYNEKTAPGSSNSGGVVQTTATHKVNSTTIPDAGAAGPNVVREVSSQPNDHGSFTVSERTTVYNERSAPGSSNSGGVVQTTATRKVNSTTVPAPVAAGPNVVREVDSQPNDHGSFTTSERTTVYSEQTAVAISNFATERAVTTVKTHSPGKAIATKGNASANPNDHGTATTQVTEYSPHFIDSGWIVWQRKSVTTRGTYTYQCGVRVFVNAPNPAFALGGATDNDVQLSPRINRYGLYDGQAHYSTLIKFEEHGEGSGMFGGIQDGQITFKGTTYNTKVFYGHGNEGSEAYYKANCIIVPGLNLPERMYITGVVSANS